MCPPYCVFEDNILYKHCAYDANYLQNWRSWQISDSIDFHAKFHLRRAQR